MIAVHSGGAYPDCDDGPNRFYFFLVVETNNWTKSSNRFSVALSPAFYHDWVRGATGRDIRCRYQFKNKQKRDISILLCISRLLTLGLKYYRYIEHGMINRTDGKLNKDLH